MKIVIFLISCLVLLGHVNVDAQCSSYSRTGSYYIKGAQKTRRYNTYKKRRIRGYSKKHRYNTKSLKGKTKLRRIYRPYAKKVHTSREVVPSTVIELSTPQHTMLQRARQFSQGAGAQYDIFVFDVTSFVNQNYPQLSGALAENIVAATNLETPSKVVATPLAAAFRAANEHHFQNSKPIPQDVKKALEGHFSPYVLNNARYTVGEVEITLSDGTEKVAIYGNPVAVTVGNVIVFREDPGSFSQNNVWWLREVTRVGQFADLGTEDFAYQYMKDFGNSIGHSTEKNLEKILNY